MTTSKKLRKKHFSAQFWGNTLMKSYNSMWKHLCNGECDLTPKQMEKRDREYAVYLKKEEKRRSKKVTMTVGELEDKLADAHYDD